MTSIEQVAAFLDQFAPARLAEDWDNVGLLVGDPRRSVRRVMTCLTITPASAREAVEAEAQLIVSHHPLPFHAIRRLTAESTAGRILLELTAARIGVYSPHTAFDSCPNGINQRLAEGLGLEGIEPLVPGDDQGGSGRRGQLPKPVTLIELAHRVKRFLAIDQVQIVGTPEQPVHTIGVACGAAGAFLEPAREAGCDGMLTGETQFHTCLEAQAAGIGLVLPGHYASERFAVEYLADVLGGEFPDLEVWASRKEQDPLQRV